MQAVAATFLLALLASLLLTPAVRFAAHRFGVLDHALTSRKIHGRPVARLGGVAIAVAFYLPLAVLTVFRAFSAAGEPFLFADQRLTVGLLVGGAFMAAVGLLDDVRGAPAGLKLAAQVAAAVFAWWMGFRIDSLASPFGAPLVLGVLSLPFTVLWVVGVTNALNLIDGLDGLAGGVALSAVLVTFVAALLQGHAQVALVAACLAGAILGFLRHNFNPASIFMGDAGSLFLGFVLAVVSVEAHVKSSAAVALVVPVVALALPIADTLLAMGRRWLRGMPVFRADREHIHHRLLALGLTQRQVALALYGVCVVLAGAALALATSSGVRAALVLGGVAALGVLGLRRLGFLRLRSLQAMLERRRRNLTLRENMEGISARLRHASELAEVWEAVKGAKRMLGATSVGLRFAGGDGRPGSRERQGFHWRRPGAEAEEELAVTRHSLRVERPGDVIELGWARERALDGDAELAVELLCRDVHAAVARIERGSRRPAQELLRPVNEAGLEPAPRRRASGDQE